MRDEMPQRPASDDDRDGWKAYWAKIQPAEWFEKWGHWRTEPEINEERKRYLAQRRTVLPDIERGIYPFRDEKGGINLNRADVEWLLVSHTSGGVIGPVDWQDGKQSERAGLDLRGADVSFADLSRMPLSRLRGGLQHEERSALSPTKRYLGGMYAKGTDFAWAHLEQAKLYAVNFAGSNLWETHLEGASLARSHMENTNLFSTYLGGSDLRYAIFDTETNLRRTTFVDNGHGAARLSGIRWGGADLTGVDWSKMKSLGDETLARQRTDRAGHRLSSADRLHEFMRATRAYRQLATALRQQGQVDDADRFAYRAQTLHRTVLRREGRWGVALGSWLLNLISGYGYKPLRSLVAYIVIILAFAGAYLLNAQFAAPHLTWDESLVLSISSFHGRGFFSSGISLGDTLARLAAGEAIIGLLIEISFIATFTQRFFAR